jgi:hypothetical protein
MKKLMIVLIGTCLCGCVVHNAQIHDKSTVFGFQVVTPGTSGTQIKIQVGLVRNDLLINPTSTNGPITAAPWTSHVKANLSAIKQDVEEDTTTLPSQSVTTDTNSISTIIAK